MTKKYMVLMSVMVLLLVSTVTVQAQDAGSTPAELCEQALPAAEPDTREYAEPAQVLEEGTDYRAIFCTSAGPIYVDLYEDFAPVTVNNFVFLAQNDYYNNTIFHRVIENFMAQGGDPTGTGAGGPGYQFIDEFVGFLHFDQPGLLAMANANNPQAGVFATNGSQFFITTVPTPHLDYRHTIFGEVLEGQENVESLQIRDPQAGGEASDLQTVLIVDPSEVAFEASADETYTAEQVIEAMGGVQTLLEGLDLAVTVEGPIEADVVPEDVSGFEYRVTGSVENTACDVVTFPFMSLSYSLDAFDTSDAAAEALASEAYQNAVLGEGFELAETLVFPEDVPYVTTETTACETDAVLGRVLAQRGQYIAVIEAVIPVNQNFTPDLVLDQITSRVFERPLSEILRAELR